MVPFSLYHGTSSHYLNAFLPEVSTISWPHKDVAIALLRNTWAELCASGIEPEFYVKHILDQETSQYSNWQHGDFYVTPSMQSAVRYAGANALYGGELLTMCRDALDRLKSLDPDKVEKLLTGTDSISNLLNGKGTPILVELTNVCADDLLPEKATGSVAAQLLELEKYNDGVRELYSQQTNFRFKNRDGIIARVFSINIANLGDPLTHFDKTEIYV